MSVSFCNVADASTLLFYLHASSSVESNKVISREWGLLKVQHNSVATGDSIVTHSIHCEGPRSSRCWIDADLLICVPSKLKVLGRIKAHEWSIIIVITLERIQGENVFKVIFQYSTSFPLTRIPWILTDRRTHSHLPHYGLAQDYAQPHELHSTDIKVSNGKTSATTIHISCRSYLAPRQSCTIRRCSSYQTSWCMHTPTMLRCFGADKTWRDRTDSRDFREDW